ncbi:MAG: hypothetical protein Q4C60_10450 [Eubacteriales bacterium]|nr:hypothetical protein [Eubacteriales bacterium]
MTEDESADRHTDSRAECAGIELQTLGGDSFDQAEGRAACVGTEQ